MIRRFALMLLTLFGMSILIFVMLRLVPGNISDILFESAGLVNPAEKAKIEKELGLDQPIVVQYWTWISGLLRGDLGYAYVSEKPAWDEIAPRIPITAKLAGLALFFSVILGVPLASLLLLIDHLGRRIIDAAPPSLGALFAGWRAMPIPDGVGPRVALTTHILREMRGATHIAAITALGLSPLDAVLASTNAPPRTGPAYAEQMGFTGPFRDPAEVRDRRLEAEALTASAMEPYFAQLSPAELAELGELVESTRNAIDM